MRAPSRYFSISAILAELAASPVRFLIWAARPIVCLPAARRPPEGVIGREGALGVKKTDRGARRPALRRNPSAPLESTAAPEGAAEEVTDFFTRGCVDAGSHRTSAAGHCPGEQGWQAQGREDP